MVYMVLWRNMQPIDKCTDFFYVGYTTHGTSGFTSHPKDKAVVALRTHVSRLGLDWVYLYTLIAGLILHGEAMSRMLPCTMSMAEVPLKCPGRTVQVLFTKEKCLGALVLFTCYQGLYFKEATKTIPSLPHVHCLGALKCSRVPFTEEKMPWCPCPFSKRSIQACFVVGYPNACIFFYSQSKMK